MSSDDPLAAALAAAGLGDVRPGESRPPEPRIEVVDSVPDEPQAPRELWPEGIGTGVGSLPGTDPVEASALVTGETPELPAFPELPDRGVGADMIGRATGLLVDLAVEVVGQVEAGQPGDGDLEVVGLCLLVRDGEERRRHAGARGGALREPRGRADGG